jgi:2',3'-cyclic-nucleotide 2'-phosphodiesterase (5'-nucleotidase family)
MLISIISCKNERQVKEIEGISGNFVAVATDSIQQPNRKMEAEIAPYTAKLDSVMDEVVVISKNEIYRKKPNGPLNNIVADMLFVEANKHGNVKADFCLINYGGLRRPIPAGEIKKSNIFQLMPFENEAVLVKLKPQAMKDLFYYVYVTNGQPIANMEIHYKDSVFVSAKINNEEWDSTKSYWAITSDYTANGGDRMDFFAERDSMILTGLLIRDAIFEYIDSLQDNNIPLQADSTDRIFMQ